MKLLGTSYVELRPTVFRADSYRLSRRNKTVVPRTYVRYMQLGFDGIENGGRTRRCGRCGVHKPVDDFMWRRIEKGQRDNYCRPCRAAYHREHYLKHKPRYVENARVRNQRVWEERKRWMIEFFRTHPCVDCGETDIIVLEFDHLEDKAFGVAHGARWRKWEDVLAEMAKCEVVCANCHRRRTARRNGSWRDLAATDEGKNPDLERETGIEPA